MTAPHVGVAGKTMLTTKTPKTVFPPPTHFEFKIKKKIQLVAEWGVSPIFLGLVL